MARNEYIDYMNSYYVHRRLSLWIMNNVTCLKKSLLRNQKKYSNDIVLANKGEKEDLI